MKLFYKLFMLSLWLLLYLLPGKVLSQDEGLDDYVNGEIMRRGKSYNIAVLQYNKAIEKAPSNYRYPHARGLCYLALKNYDKAIEDFNRSIQIEKSYVPSYLSLASIYEIKKEKENIIKYYNDAFVYEIDTLKKTTYKLKIIQQLFDRENLSAIEPHVKSAKLANPNSLPILYYDALLSNENEDYKVAVNSMLRAIDIAKVQKQSPDATSKYFYQLAYAYHWLGNYKEASAAIAKIFNSTYKTLAQSLMPEYTYKLAYAYYKVYEFDDAEKLLQKCVRMDSKYVNAHDLHVSIEDESRDHSNLLNHLKNSIEHETEGDPLQHKYRDICELLITNNKYEESIKYASQCIKKFPENKPVRFLKGVAEYKSKKYRNAAKTVEKLTTLKEPDIEIAAMYHFKLGRIYEKLSEIEKAKSSFKKAFYGSFKNAARQELGSLSKLDKTKKTK